MINTGFKLETSKDLIALFEPYTTGDTKADPTGYVVSTKVDLQDVFARNTSSTYLATDTKYITQNGLDLRYIFEPIVPPVITVTGTGTYSSSSVTTNRSVIYTYVFTAGTNTIAINKDIRPLNVVALGAGGSGASGNGSAGGGASGGTCGIWTFNYVKNRTFNISVASSTAGSGVNGGNTTFGDATNVMTAFGGPGGKVYATNATRPNVGATTTVSGTHGGSISSSNGGIGGASNLAQTSLNGLNANTQMYYSKDYSYSRVYLYSGGGRAGSATAFGNAGNAGTGGTLTGTQAQSNATTPGSGGGGGSSTNGSAGGQGGRGELVVIIEYP
jgi:hypothetical protein